MPFYKGETTCVNVVVPGGGTTRRHWAHKGAQGHAILELPLEHVPTMP